MKYYLAFDLGASSGRGILGHIDENGKLILEEIHRFKNFPAEADGHFRWDFKALLSEIKTGIKKAYAVTQDIVSLSVDTWGVDFAFFRNGELIRDPYCYRDSRNAEGMEAFHKNVMSVEELYGRVGIQQMVFNTLYQLYAHKAMHPEDFENGSVALLMPDALIYALSGEISAEYTIASTTAMIDPVKRTWDVELLEKAGIPVNVLPPVELPAKRTFRLSEAVAAELGVPRLGVVKCGGHDTASAVSCTPCDENTDWLYISSGTWALLGAELDQPVLSAKACDAHYTNEGAVNGKIRFLTNIMGTWLLQETRRIWQESGKDISFQEMMEMAQAAPDAGLVFPPNDQLFLAPGDMPGRIRQWFKEHGKPVPETDAALVRSIYDSLAVCFRESIQALEELLGRKFTVLHILGGAIRDDFLMGLTAKTTGMKVLTGPLEATSTGNILAQMMADGTIADCQAARELVKKSCEIRDY